MLIIIDSNISKTNIERITISTKKEKFQISSRRKTNWKVYLNIIDTGKYLL